MNTISMLTNILGQVFDVIGLGGSLIGIFALLVFLFNSYSKPLIILTTIPLGLVGVSVAFFLHQRPISFLALIGVVGLSGIIVNSGIVLISFIEQMKKTSKLGLNEILIKSAGLRLRAVVVTSLTTVGGLLPTAYGIGGADTFVFFADAGSDIIRDFEDGIDMIEFRDTVDRFSDLVITQDGNNAVITSDNGVITITDFDSALLDAADFTFI